MSRLTDRLIGALIGALLLGLIALLAASGDAGPLDPDGPPTSTMKSLDEIPGSWSRKLPASDGAAGPTPPAGCNSTRFQCVLDNEAVLDRETGLVWERSPQTDTLIWAGARNYCVDAQISGRRGWRLPTVDEISTLIDPTAAGTPRLSPGHPFGTVFGDYYWTATSVSATFARTARFDLGFSGTLEKSTLQHYWCVRGAQGYDGVG